MNKYFFALRLIKGKKKILTGANWLSFFGIFLGVFTLLVVSSVMSGLRSNMLSIVVGAKSDIQIYMKDRSPISNYLEINKRMESEFPSLKISPICTGEFVIKNSNYIAPTFSRGVIPEIHQNVTKVIESIRLGSFSNEVLENNGIVIGYSMALDLHVSVGDYVQIYSPAGTVQTPFGKMPRMKKLKVVGIFYSNMPEYSQTFSYISLKNAQYLLGISDAVNLFQVNSFDSENSDKIAAKINQKLGNELIAVPWMEFESNLYTAMLVEKIVMMVVLFFMILLSIFNLSGNILKLITQKREEIGILKAIGAKGNWVKKSFWLASMLITTSGTLLGMSLAFIIIYTQMKYTWIPLPLVGFPIDYLPMVLEQNDFLWIPGLTIIVTMIATLYPVNNIEKLDAIEIIRK